MTAIKVTGSMKPILRDLPKVQHKIVPRVTVQVLNRTAATLQTASLRAAAASLNLPTKHLRNRVRVRKANRDSMVASRRLDLTPIDARTLGAARETRSGVTVGRRRYPGAFLARSPGTGRRQVFRRVGRPRVPLLIEKVVIDSQMRDAFSHQFLVRGSGVFVKEFDRRLRAALARRGSR